MLQHLRGSSALYDQRSADLERLVPAAPKCRWRRYRGATFRAQVWTLSSSFGILQISYSQLIMPPWATGRAAIPGDPADIDYQTQVSNRMQSALYNTHGKTYRVGQSRDVVGYPAGGTTEDYSYQDLGKPVYPLNSITFYNN